MKEKRRVGIYGGTFNPPHNGHVFIAQRFAEELMLDELMIIPDYLPPHKEFSGTVSVEERLEMCRLAFGHIPTARISDMEIKRGGRSYTYITLEELADKDVDLFLLIGTDMMLTFDSWRRFEYIFELATVCYARRENDEKTGVLLENKVDMFRKNYGAKIINISNSPAPVSSSEIRSGNDEYRRRHLPTAVYEYIKARGLYGN